MIDQQQILATKYLLTTGLGVRVSWATGGSSIHTSTKAMVVVVLIVFVVVFAVIVGGGVSVGVDVGVDVGVVIDVVTVGIFVV